MDISTRKDFAKFLTQSIRPHCASLFDLDFHISLLTSVSSKDAQSYMITQLLSLLNNSSIGQDITAAIVTEWSARYKITQLPDEVNSKLKDWPFYILSM
jgi:hypothetical protein